MGDWYTGSGTVFVKEMVRYGLGIQPTLDGLIIQTPSYIPADEAKISLKIKGCPVTLSYRNQGKGKRTFTVNGKEIAGKYDDLMAVEKLTLTNEQLKNALEIEITD